MRRSHAASWRSAPSSSGAPAARRRCDAGRRRPRQHDAVGRRPPAISSPWCGARRPTAAAATCSLAVSRDGGRPFGAPVQVNAVAGEARISGEIAAARGAVPRRRRRDPSRDRALDRRRTARTADPDPRARAMAARRSHRRRPAGAGRAGRSRLARAGASTARGVPMPSGSIIAAWPRRPASSSMRVIADAQRPKHDGVAMAQKSGLYYRYLRPPAKRRSRTVQGRLLLLQDRPRHRRRRRVFAAWRHVFAGNFRDIGFTQSRDGGKSFSPPCASAKTAGRSTAAPTMARRWRSMRAGTVHLVWPTVIGGDRRRALLCRRRATASFSKPRQRVPTLGSPKPSHPQIVIDATGRVVVAWDEVVDGRRAASVRRVTLSRHVASPSARS